MKHESNSTDWIFLTWHYQARSRNIARAMHIPLYELQIDRPLWWRFLASICWTTWVLAKARPSVILMQYSFALLLQATLYKLLRRRKTVLVVDCHTKALRRMIGGRLRSLFAAIKRWTFNHADIVMVTIPELVPEVPSNAPSVIVLHDPLPLIPEPHTTEYGDDYCVFVSSFASDEPIEAMIAAARSLDPEITVYWTGRSGSNNSLISSIPDNVRLTGYLPDEEYQSLLARAACIGAFTTEDSCLMSAAYEAVAAEVPLVMSNTNALRSFFNGAAVYCEHTGDSISSAVRDLLENGAAMKPHVRAVGLRISRDFQSSLNDLICGIEDACSW